MRVGLVAKGLLLKGDLDLELVLLCKEKPTTALLDKVADNLAIQLTVSVPASTGDAGWSGADMANCTVRREACAHPAWPLLFPRFCSCPAARPGWGPTVYQVALGMTVTSRLQQWMDGRVAAKDIPP